MDISIVVAMSENYVIGRANALPWRLPEDLKYFKRITMGHPVIMGRKTFESIGRALPGRLNLVISRQEGWKADGAVHANSLAEGLRLGQEDARAKGLKQVMVIGGADLYAQAFDHCTRLYLTQVHAQIDGDAFFPRFDPEQWTETSRQHHPADEQNSQAYSFIVLQRKA